VCTFIIYNNVFVEAIYSRILYYDLIISISNEIYENTSLLINGTLGEEPLLLNSDDTLLYINQKPEGSIIYKSQYDLSESTCSTSCTYSLSDNVFVALTAVPAAGYVFDKWVGGPCDGSSENICAFLMDQEYSIIANFKIPSYTVTIINVGDGVGRTYSEPFGIDCTPYVPSITCSYEFLSGTLVTIFANSSAGSDYFGMSSYQVGNTTSNSLSFKITENIVISAQYVGMVYYNFNFNKSGAGANQSRFFTIPMGINCGTNCTNTVSSFLESTTVTLDAEIATNRQILYYTSTRPIKYKYVAGDGISINGNDDESFNTGEFFIFDESVLVTNKSEGVPYVQDNNRSIIVSYKEVTVNMTDDITVTSIMI
jgi:hypothetical protein